MNERDAKNREGRGKKVRASSVVSQATGVSVKVIERPRKGHVMEEDGRQARRHKVEKYG